MAFTTNQALLPEDTNAAAATSTGSSFDEPRQYPLMIRVFIADDHAVVREGLARILDSMDDMRCVGTSADGREVLRLAERGGWDVVVLDLSGLGSLGGLQVLDGLRASRPDLPVIVYSMYPEEQYGVRVLQAGARAYLGKGRPTSILLDAIRKVALGQRFVTENIADRLIEAKGEPKSDLTAREFEVLTLIVEGQSPTRIAEMLCLSASTVSTHIRHLKDKLGAQSTSDLVRIALRDGLAREPG